MTTYSINAFSVTYDQFSDEANSLTPALVEIAFTEGVDSFTYTVSDPGSAGELPNVEVNDGLSPGDQTSVRIDGASLSDTVDVSLGVPSRMITLTLADRHFSWHVRF